MRDLRVGVVGRILVGDEVGRFVEIVDDHANTGGWLIFTYGNADRSGEVFDAWVVSIIDVDRYFDEAAWEIDWQP